MSKMRTEVVVVMLQRKSNGPAPVGSAVLVYPDGGSEDGTRMRQYDSDFSLLSQFKTRRVGSVDGVWDGG